MLEHEDAAGSQQVAVEDEFGKGGELFEGVGRVGKNQVELAVATLQETKHVAAHQYGIGVTDTLHALADERMVGTVEFHAHHLGTASRQQFERDAAGSRKEVEGVSTVEVYVTVEHIEDILLGEVGGGTCLERTGHVEPAAFVFSGNDTH